MTVQESKAAALTATPYGVPVDDAPSWDGAVAHMLDASGQTHAWLVDEPVDGLVGYVKGVPDHDGTLRVANPHSWADIADSLGLSEFVPAQPPEGEAPADDEVPVDEVDAENGPPPEGKAAPLAASGTTAPADDEEQNGIMVAFVVPEGDAADLALDHPTALPASQLHLTLAYLGSTEEVADDGAFYADVLEALRDVAAEYDPVTANVSGVGRFSIPGDADAFYYSVDAPELPELRQAVVEALEENGLDVSHEHGFTPHITACYVKEGEDNPLRRAEPKVLNFDALVFCFGDQRLSIRLGGKDPEEADAEFTPDMAGRPGHLDSTAPSAMPGVKGANPFAKNGKGKIGKRGGPPIATGAWVSWGNQRGRVDLVVTNGTVPGVEEDITGSKDKPAARVVVYEQGAGKKWKATGKKVGVSASSLKRSFPLTGGFGKKALDLADPEAALVEVLTGYYETADTKEYGTVDPVAVRTVYERGLLSWPGEHTAVPNEAWALGRTKAFLTVAAGGEVKGYDADLDLLPAGHPLAVVNTGGPELVLSPEQSEQVAEEKVAVTITEGERIDSETVQATINELLRFARPSA